MTLLLLCRSQHMVVVVVRPALHHRGAVAPKTATLSLRALPHCLQTAPPPRPRAPHNRREEGCNPSNYYCTTILLFETNLAALGGGAVFTRAVVSWYHDQRQVVVIKRRPWWW